MSVEEGPLPFILHVEVIRRLADAGAYRRGKDYFDSGRVVALSRSGGALRATVHGTEDYAVRLWSKDGSLAFSCTCPVGTDGDFCKHAVAVSLAWLARQAPPSPALDDNVLRERLAMCSPQVLAALLVGAAHESPKLRARLQALVSKA